MRTNKSLKVAIRFVWPGMLALVSSCAILRPQPVEVPRIVLQTVVMTANPSPSLASTTIPPAERSQVSGRLCYPSEGIPPMTIYAREQVTQETYSIHVTEGEYRIEIPKPGTYLVFAWTDPGAFTPNRVGGVYSCHAIDVALTTFFRKGQADRPQNPCADRFDHNPLPVPVGVGESLANIDVCDYYSQEHVPLP